jgi:hypothetical protein
MSQAGGFFSPGSVSVYTLTGNSGYPVSPLNNNINIVGDGTSIVVSGDPIGHTLTASVVPNRYVEAIRVDGGAIAYPTGGGIISLVGGENISVTRLGSIVTVSSPTQMIPYVDVNVSPYIVALNDNYISVDTSALSIAVQLPDAPILNKTFIVKDRIGQAAVRNITVTTVSGAILIDGVLNYLMNVNYQAAQFLWNGASYEVF